MSFTEISPNVMHIHIENPWQNAFYQKMLLNLSEGATISNIEEKISNVSLGFFESLDQLPAGVVAKSIGYPESFPVLGDNQILACHGDRLINKPLIACFKQAHVQEVESAYRKGMLVARDWVVLTLSDSAKKDLKVEI